MRIGVPREIKNHEYRVGLTPESVQELVSDGHKVSIETGAGVGIGANDELYIKAGADILGSAEEIFASAEMIVKVKEPQAGERKMLRPDQILFTYLHLAPDPEQTRDLMESGATCIAYETVTDTDATLPLLRPMSQVAGRLSIQVGATALQKNAGGRGVLLGGVAGTAPAKVVIIGGGDVGFNAAQMAVGMEADVTILERDSKVINRLKSYFGGRAKVVHSSPAILESLLPTTDLVVGAVLVHGSAAPKLVSRQMLGLMEEGSVLVDVAIDQGGCFETSRPTTHENPTYDVDGIVHYCVANMPGAVGRTSTYALNSATIAPARRIASLGWKKALQDDPHLLNGLNVCGGHVTYRAVGLALGLDTKPASSFL